MRDADAITDIELRAYFASVIGAVRAPYGTKRTSVPFTPGKTQEIAQNATKNRVLHVTVSRADVLLPDVTMVFSQNPSASGSSNDFVVDFTGTSVFRFVLKPEDSLNLTMTAGASAVIVVAQETY